MADERDRLRARLGLPPLGTAATTVVAPKPASTNTPLVIDPQDVRDPKTGLTPAQVAAQKAQQEALTAAAGARIPVAVTGATTGMVGTIVKGPTTPPREGYEWASRSVAGGGVTWYERPIPGYFLGRGSGGGGTGDGAGGGGGKDDAATKALIEFNKAQAEANTKAVRESAFALLKLEFDKYGLGSLVDTVKNYIMQGSPVEEVTLRLRETPEYQARFAGNQARLKAGLNVYDEATYLQLENAYDQVFTSYGVTEAAGNTVEARRARYAQFIGGTISPDEVKGRVQLAVAAANEDEVTKATLRELYPMISEKDIVSYFLNPKETLPKLETKVRASQIGAAAVRQGLVTNVATAEELVAMGVTEDEAERAYSAYAGMKPTLDKLSGLERDQELAVNQQVAEGALLKGLASEQRKLEALRQKELARFSGSAGTARGVSLGSAAGGAI